MLIARRRYFWPIGTLPGGDVQLRGLAVTGVFRSAENYEPVIVNGSVELPDVDGPPITAALWYDADGRRYALRADSSVFVEVSE